MGELAHGGGHARVERQGADEPVLAAEERLARTAATCSRPVTARASRMAAEVASEAFLVNFTISAPVTVRDEVLGRVELHRGGPGEPDPAADRRADGRHHGLVGVPQRDGAHAGAVLDEPVAVGVAHPRARGPSTMTGAMPSGNWSAPRAKVCAPPAPARAGAAGGRSSARMRYSHDELLAMIKGAVSRSRNPPGAPSGPLYELGSLAAGADPLGGVRIRNRHQAAFLHPRREQRCSPRWPVTRETTPQVPRLLRGQSSSCRLFMSTRSSTTRPVASGSSRAM